MNASTLRRGGALVAALVVAIPAVASAHTETNVVAVPAGSTAVVTFAPAHGCGDSPTVDIRIQAPTEGATAVEQEGWTTSSTPDGAGNTVLQWSGGSLPADQAGSFQVEFTVPDAVGTLLAFPAVQSCANGAQEPWIETEPGAESPAPQLLVLAAGSEPATTLDDVPADAPGRDALAAILTGEPTHVDAGAATTAPATTAAAPQRRRPRRRRPPHRRRQHPRRPRRRTPSRPSRPRRTRRASRRPPETAETDRPAGSSAP